MNQVQRATLAIRICSEIRNMGGYVKNKDKAQTVIREKTKGNPKDMRTLTYLVEALI